MPLFTGVLRDLCIVWRFFKHFSWRNKILWLSLHSRTKKYKHCYEDYDTEELPRQGDLAQRGDRGAGADDCRV